MVGTVLLALTKNFDDMLFFTCQVILEEKGNDVIIVSKSKGTCKGQDTSVMTVSLEEALNQENNYNGLIIIGGDEIDSWDLLLSTIDSFQENGKLLGLNSSNIQICDKFGFPTNQEDIQVKSNIVYLHNLNESEKYAERLASEIN